MENPQRKGNGNPSRKSPRPNRDMVEKLTAAGLNADAVAQILNVNKNKLRAEHALALANGRATLKKRKAEAEAAALTSEEKFAASAILVCFADGEWIDAGRSLLWSGLDAGGAKNAADAFAKWQADGGHFICAGRNSNFGAQRLKEFAALKAAAQKLLKQRR